MGIMQTGATPRLMGVGETIAALEALQPGERLAFFEGAGFKNCPDRVRKAVVALREAGRIDTFQARSEPPMVAGQVNSIHGIGTFTFIAVGKQPKRHLRLVR